MQDIYDQHRAAFAQVSAFVVIDASGERVATVAFKFPRDGAGRLYCYLYVIGLPMVRGFASGYGYDKKGAAFADACSKLMNHPAPAVSEGEWAIKRHSDMIVPLCNWRALGKGIGGRDWNNVLADAGFTVIQAV